jgi:hypothetical protein
LNIAENNGMTKAFNNKMEVISSRSYVFRNFKNCRLSNGKSPMLLLLLAPLIGAGPKINCR